MELTINIENKNVYQSLTQFLHSIGIKTISEKKKRKIIDEVTLISENALAEEWNSKEDEKWDKVL